MDKQCPYYIVNMSGFKFSLPDIKIPDLCPGTSFNQTHLGNNGYTKIGPKHRRICQRKAYFYGKDDPPFVVIDGKEKPYDPNADVCPQLCKDVWY